MQIKEPLLQIKLQSIENFIKDNKLGEIEEIRFRKNPCKNPSTYSHEPYSIEVRYTSTSGTLKGLVFSSHGVANIFNGKRYLYSTDSEERFSIENPELHKITYAWTTMLARELESTSFIENEIDYRRKMHNKIDNERSKVAAIKSYYKNELSKLEDSGQLDSRIGLQTKDYYMDYTLLSDTLSSSKALQTKCIKGLTQVLEDVKE